MVQGATHVREVESDCCQACKKDRERKNLPLRHLIVLPDEICALEFAKDVPLRLCEFCDGPELEGARREHAKRTNPGA